MLHSLRGRGRKRERGQILVLFELFFILIIAFAALVIDLGVLRNNRQILVNTFDAAALAGGTMLPVTGSTEAATLKSMVDKNIQANYPGLPTSAYTVTYRCLIGIDANTGATLISQVPGVCDPTHALGHTPTVNDFAGAGSTRAAPCNPTLGDKCNVVVIMGSATTTYRLAPIVGVNSGSSGQVVSAACKGPCGANVDVPVDLVIILDRTGSMADGSNTTGAKIHALRSAAETVLGVYNPAKQRVALALTGPGAVNSSGSATLGSCSGGGTGYGVPDDRNFSPTTTLTPSGSTTVSPLGSGTFLNTTLSAAITSTTATTIKVTSAANFPATAFTIEVDNEQMRVTGGFGTTTWTVTRGYNGTTRATHLNARPVGWGVSTTDTTIKMTSTAAFPTTYPFTILVESEQMNVTASPSANTWTVTRAAGGTTAALHGGNVTVNQIYPAGGTTLRVASATGFPTSGQYTVNVVRGTNNEHLLVTGGQGTTTWTVTRAQDSTTATYYLGGEAVTRVVGKNDTTIQVGARYGPAFPSTPFTIAVASTGSTVDYEHMVVTSVSGASAPYTWTVTRAQDGTPAATHNSGATIDGVAPWVPNSSNVGVWVPLGFSGTDTDVPLPAITGTAGTYSVAGVVQTTTPLYKSIECIWASTQGTNLATPIQMAQWYLAHYGRPGVTQGIILETDGQPQVGFASGDQSGTNFAYTCQAALDAATAAKADTTNSPDGIQIFTIGYGVTSSSLCPTRTTNLTTSNTTSNMYESATWSGKPTTQVLAAMATDASHYFENPTSAQLTSVFTQAAAMLLKGGPHLVQLYPAPIVTSASGPVTSVSITGKYFTGASSVRFGMTAATSFTVNSDSSITARVPASASGSVVDVTVTTPGGSSIVTPMDRYTYP